MYSINQINNSADKIFESVGYPDKKNEFWKYTNLKKFKSLNLIDPSNYNINLESISAFKELYFPTITIYNGKIVSLPKNEYCLLISEKFKNCSKDFYESFINKQDIVKNNPFLILNAAHFKEGVSVTLDDKFKNILIQIINDGENDNYKTSFSRVHLEIEKNVNSNIIIHHLGVNAKKYYKNNVLNVASNEGSKVSITNFFEESNQSYSMNNIILNQKKHSDIKQSSFYMSSGFIRTDITNNLNEPESYSSINGLFLGDKEEFIDNNIIINHNSNHTYSKVLYKGILDGNSKAVFNALVNVPSNSSQIDSDQKNHNIILSKAAKINSNPKLKISCDDVKCAHGSTIGNLDNEALFYLRSRGIDLKKSKQILLNSFMGDLIERLPFDELKKYIKNKIDSSNK